jgi:hypothetical protein
MSIITLARDPNDNTAQIQAAVDALKAAGGGTVVLDGVGGPSVPWVIRRPVLLDGGGLALRGLGKMTTYVTSDGTFSPFIHGYLRAREAPASHWESLSPYLDATAGQRYGIRTAGVRNVSFPASSFECYPWESVRKFTIDFAILCHSFSADQSVPLFGVSDRNGKPAPLLVGLGTEANRINVSLQVQGLGFVNFPINWKPTLGTFHRVTIQVDLDAGSCALWADGDRKGVVTAAALAGKSLVKKEDNAVGRLGSVSYDQYSWGQNWGGPHDTLYGGFKVTPSLVYTPDQTQARIDGQPITDARRYYDHAADTVFSLPLAEPAPPDRLVPWRGPFVAGVGNARGYGQLLKQGTGGQDVCTGLRISDVWVASSFAPYGCGLLVGGANDLYVRDAKVNGGAYSLLNAPTFVGYPHAYDRVTFSRGAIAGFVAHRTTLRMQTCQHISYGRHAMMLLGANAVIHQGLFAEVPGCESAVRILDGQSGGSYVFDDGTLFDFEGTQPSRSNIEIDGHATGGVLPPSTTLFLQNMALARPGALNAYVVCNTPTSPPAGQTPYRVVFSHVSRYPHASAMVTGPGWVVTNEGYSPPGVPLAVDANGDEIEEDEE